MDNYSNFVVFYRIFNYTFKNMWDNTIILYTILFPSI